MLNTIEKTTIHNISPEMFNHYIALVEDENLDLAFTNSIIDLWLLEMDWIEELKELRYEPGKWTVKEILQHLGDVERILCAGVLRVVRGEAGCNIEFNANDMVQQGRANEKGVEKIIEDLINVRKSTHSLYRTLSTEELQKDGIHWKHRVSVVTMGYIIIGHQEHHLKIIKEKYFPLLKKGQYASY